MKRLIIALSFVALSGCSSLATMVPSFWDDNQSARIIDVRSKVENIECKQVQLPQAEAILKDIQWFELYSQSKGTRQQDVIKIVTPMKETAEDWVKRSRDKEGSEAYCNLKKRTLKLQSERAAQAILGRF
jgi:flagellar basal body L-ring protein FlgH